MNIYQTILINKSQALTAYIIKCGFGADNQGLQPASTSVLFDRKVPRNPPLIIYAERYFPTFPPLIPLFHCLLFTFSRKGAKSFHFAEKGRFWGFFWAKKKNRPEFLHDGPL